MTTLFLNAAAALLMAAGSPPPTAPTYGQVRMIAPDNGATSSNLFLMGVYKGQFVAVSIGPGLQVAATSNGISITSNVSAPVSSASPLYGLLSILQADGSWMVQAPAGSLLSGALVVTINGLRMREGLDYARDAANPARITIIPGAYAPDAQSVVLFDYPGAK